MKTATIRDLRNNFAQLAGWIESGETVQLTKRGALFAQIVPVAKSQNKLRMPDFSTRARRISLGKKIDTAAILEANRGRY